MYDALDLIAITVVVINAAAIAIFLEELSIIIIIIIWPNLSAAQFKLRSLYLYPIFLYYIHIGEALR